MIVMTIALLFLDHYCILCKIFQLFYNNTWTFISKVKPTQVHSQAREPESKACRAQSCMYCPSGCTVSQRRPNCGRTSLGMLGGMPIPYPPTEMPSPRRRNKNSLLILDLPALKTHSITTEPPLAGTLLCKQSHAMCTNMAIPSPPIRWALAGSLWQSKAYSAAVRRVDSESGIKATNLALLHNRSL